MLDSLAPDHDMPLDPAQVVLPSIFDAAAQPDIVLPLVLANLLSPALWALSGKVRQRASATTPLAQGSDTATRTDAGLPASLRAIQAQIDRYFEHLTPIRTASLFGELDLDEESARLGPDVIDRALALILAAIRRRVSGGTLDPAIEAALLAQVASRRFPAYQYASYDVVHANRRLIRDRRRVPHGLTSCLDETAIFAALVMTLPEVEVSTVVCLCCPEHYTAFGWSETGESWWLYGKNALISESGWKRIVDVDYAGDVQRAFDQRLAHFDRIISPNGTFFFDTGRSSIPQENLLRILGRMERYFGGRLEQIRGAMERPVTWLSPSPFAPVFRALVIDRSEGVVMDLLTRSGDPGTRRVMQLVLFAYRSLAVDDLSPYLVAARRSPACRALGADLASIEAALERVRSIPGRESIFNDRERIAMPEETLRLGRGSDRDLALLLHVLIEASPVCVEGAGVETWFTADDSFVMAGGRCISLVAMDFVRIDTAKMLTGRRMAAGGWYGADR